MQTHISTVFQIRGNVGVACRNQPRAFTSAVPVKRANPARRVRLVTSATAAPPAASPFASVDSEAKLYAILNAGVSQGQVNSA